MACADSRTSPELIFDQNIGDLFVVRTAGNLAGEHALGSIEYAVAHLGVRLVVVLGHERCGAVTAALEGAVCGRESRIAGSRDIQPAVAAAKDKEGDALENTVVKNAELVAAKIRNDAEFGEDAEKVQVVAAVYDLDTGKIEWLDD
ncbi:MAG TPA: carbonic anhydrase [Verrucomicrobiales bacterium]|nr:carbonic anhydrase [Verrucomicrobiales bacterium]